MGPRVPFVPLPLGNLARFFVLFERCLFNIVYVVRFLIKSTKRMCCVVTEFVYMLVQLTVLKTTGDWYFYQKFLSHENPKTAHKKGKGSNNSKPTIHSVVRTETSFVPRPTLPLDLCGAAVWALLLPVALRQ